MAYVTYDDQLEQKRVHRKQIFQLFSSPLSLFFSLRIGNLRFLTIHSNRELFWGFSCNASTQTDWKISLYSQWIRELDCNLKNKRSYNFFLVDQRVFQNLFLERSKVENIYILGCVFLKATRGTEIGVTE